MVALSLPSSFLAVLELLADNDATKKKYQALQDAVDSANKSLAAAAADHAKIDGELRAHRDRLAAMRAEHDDRLAQETAERRQELDERESVINSRERKLLASEDALVRAQAKLEAEARGRMAEIDAKHADLQRVALRR